MIKGRSKVFVPKKIIRNSQISQSAYPTPSPTQVDENSLEGNENRTTSVEIPPKVIENLPCSQLAHPTSSPWQVDTNSSGNTETQIISVEIPPDRPNLGTAPDEAIVPKAAPKVKKKYNKKPQTVQNDVLIEETLDDMKKNIQKKVRRKRKRRESTPEGSETKKIDPSVITMHDLCRDLRIGKKSRNHDEIMGRLARLKQNAIKAKMKRDNPEMHDYVNGESDDNRTLGDKRQTVSDSKRNFTPPPVPTAGPRIRIVDGQIVTDEQSLQIDRHKRARENQCEEEEIVEENDFTRVITCGNYLKRERSQHWDLPSNELFWKGLRMFGTDFEMIAKMFPHRSRRQIKLKFNAEERSNPQKVNRVLMGIKTEAIDLDEFQRLGNLELEDLADIKAEQAQVEKEQSELLKVALENT